MGEYEWTYVPENEVPPMPPPPVMKPVFTHNVTPPVVNNIKYPKVGLMDVVLFTVVMYYLKKSVRGLFPDKF